MNELHSPAECENGAEQCAPSHINAPALDFAAWKREIRAFAEQMQAELAAISNAASSGATAATGRLAAAELLDEMLEAVSASTGDDECADRELLSHFRPGVER
jgi:hypothetical protein